MSMMIGTAAGPQPVRFGLTQWHSNEITAGRREVGATCVFGTMDLPEFSSRFPFALLPTQNETKKPRLAGDQVHLSLSARIARAGIPTSTDGLTNAHNFGVSFHYPERGMPEDADLRYANDYASGYEIQWIDSQEKARKIWDFLPEVRLEGDYASTDVLREAMFMDILFRAECDALRALQLVFDYRAAGNLPPELVKPVWGSREYDQNRALQFEALKQHADFFSQEPERKKAYDHLMSVRDNGNRLLTQWRWLIGSAAKSRQDLLPRMVQMFVPKTMVRQRLFNELIGLTLPETSAPHKPYFSR